MLKKAKEIPSIEVLGNRVHMVQIPEVVELMSYWIEEEPQKCHWIVATGMHGIMEAHENSNFKAILNSSDLFVPDGIPLIWIARYLGFPLKKRVCGADLMSEFFRHASKKGYRNFFYGKSRETLEQLVSKLSRSFPGLKIVGVYPSASTAEEDRKVIREINQKKPDVLWVGLGLPWQERWIFEYKDRLRVPVVIGVGAAFDFLSGKVKRAPAWIGDRGLEWLWRLVCEPRNWPRIFLGGLFLYGPKFVFLVSSELISRKLRERQHGK